MSHYSAPVDLCAIVSEALPSFFSHRRGKLGPSQTFLTLVSMRLFGQRGYRRVVTEMQDQLARKLGWDRDGRPSGAAVCMARQKLTLEHCRTAFRAVSDACSLAREQPEFRYRGLRVVSFDGTRVSLPDAPALRDAFGGPSNQHGTAGCPAAGLMMLWDVSAQQPVDFVLAPYKHNERELAMKLMDEIPDQSLLITDRGFPSFDFIEQLMHRDQPFLMRISKVSRSYINDFLQGDKRDAVVTITPPTKKSHHSHAYAVRLLKVRLPSGEDEILITNLMDEQEYQAAELGRLYTTRWRIETAFREMKVWHALEHFSARHVLGIHQEIYAIFTFALLVSNLEARVRDEHAKALTHDPDTPLPDIRFNRLIIADAVADIMGLAGEGRRAVERRVERVLADSWRYREKRRIRQAPRKRKAPAQGYTKQGRK